MYVCVHARMSAFVVEAPCWLGPRTPGVTRLSQGTMLTRGWARAEDCRMLPEMPEHPSGDPAHDAVDINALYQAE